VKKETPIVILSDNETTVDLLNNEAIAKTISVRYVIVGLGINDILFPAFPFTAPSEKVNAGDIISGYRQLIARGHRKRIRVIGATTRRLRTLPSRGW
jgi:lysophospholipase L1-like esterase